MSLTVVATLTPKPGRADAVREVLTAAVPQVHQEPGCEVYALHEDDRGFVFVERWASAEAVRAHATAPAITSALAAIADDLTEPIDVRIVTPLGGGDPGKGVV